MRNEITVAVAVLSLLAAAGDAGGGPASAFAPGASADKEAGPHTRGIGRARVTVRVYDTTVMPVADQTVALRAATGVLAAAGIDVAWLACGRGNSAMNPSGCDTPIGRAEVAVRLLRLPGAPTMQGELSLGYSLIDVPAAAGALATIYVDRVAWFSARANVDMRLVLGRAIAHEIGHLLQGTNAHGAAGLMRAVWLRTELQRDDPSDWLFTTSESLAMRAALRHREQQIHMAAHIIWTK